MKRLAFSLVVLLILVLSAFIPVLQILVLTVNGAFISLFTSSVHTITLLVNGFASISMLLLFYLSKTFAAKVISVIGVILFFIPLLFYATENIIGADEYYFFRFLIIGLIAGLSILALEIIKYKPFK